MNQDLTKLYPAILKAHTNTPYHFEKIENQETIKAYNPICGDRFKVFVDYSENKIQTLHFFGYGCSVSKASTSVLAKSLEGKSLKEALQLCDHFLKFVSNESPPDGVNLSEEFLAFSGVRDFPERLECAALSWREMKKFLEKLKISQ